ncbi:uncharacterized protein METZ01_LOCUS483432 [marine metagenome]|uniref:Uncharacterized protein n=1 Tax=marine metagenome TaxID=408172 RepID=A0A383CG73_9ZZZZ
MVLSLSLRVLSLSTPPIEHGYYFGLR